MKVKRVRFPESKRIEPEKSASSEHVPMDEKNESIVRLRKKWKILFELT